MALKVLVSSGKGGVGKTTTSLNLGAAFNYFGKDVIVLDANLTTPNIGLHLGVPVVPINLNHVLQGKGNINDAVYLHHSGTKIVPASISLEDLKKTDPEKLKQTIKSLDHKADIILVDCAAGLGREAMYAMDAVDEVLVVTNAELPAITDALKTIKIAKELGKEITGVVLTKTKKDSLEVPLKNIETILEHPIIGNIPADRAVREALNMKDLVIYTHPKSKAAVKYKKLAADLLGVKYKEEVKKAESKVMKFFRFLGLR